jgi:hypothetical protein
VKQPTDDLAAEIRAKHKQVQVLCKRSIEALVEVGSLLISAQKQQGYGDWGQFLVACQVTRTTAWRYMRLAQDWDPARHQLRRGLMICDVYRGIGLLPELSGGGRRLGQVELDRRHALEQLVFHFDLVEVGLRELSRFEENPLLARLDDIPIDRLQQDCRAAERAAQYYREAVDAKLRTIPV